MEYVSTPRGSLVLLAPFFLIMLALFGLRGFTTQVVTATAGAAGLLYAGWWLGHRAAFKFKVACLLSMCLAIIVVFAMAYAVFFWNLPGSFRLSNELLTENMRDDYQAYNARFLEQTRHHYYLTLMRGQASVVHDVLTKREKITADRHASSGRIGAREVLRYSYTVSLLPSADPNHPPRVRQEHSLSIMDAETNALLFHFPDVVELDVPVVHIGEQRLMHRLVNAGTQAGVGEALADLVEAKQLERDESQAAMNRIVTLQPNLEMSHFVYFSAAVMTTVGSNDISPNNRSMRVLVVFQSLLAVFFFGYALHFLWPERGQGAG
ncbi:MAG: potassium channel family protein [Acidobacteria bacterium]|nr:potassium channel family protein [Acidobacteriota bacterium]